MLRIKIPYFGGGAGAPQAAVLQIRNLVPSSKMQIRYFDLFIYEPNCFPSPYFARYKPEYAMERWKTHAASLFFQHEGYL